MNDDDLDSRLRTWGTAARASVPTAPMIAVSEAPGRARRMAPLLAAAAVVAVAVGVGTFVTQRPPTAPTVTAGASTVVPWADLNAVPEAAPSPLTPPPLDRTVALCRPEHLSARYSALDRGGGHTFQNLVLTNGGAGACRLEGGLDRLSGVQGSTRRDIPVKEFPALGSVEPVVLMPGQAGEVSLAWYGRCDVPGMPQQPPYTHLVLTLLGGDVPVRTDMAGSGIPAGLDLGCLPVGTPVSVSRLGTTPPEPVYPHDPRADLHVSLDLPAAVTAGEVLRYVVHLTNPTAAAIALQPCPSFLQVLSSAKVANQLNCAAAHVVAPRETESFAMELTVPANAEPMSAQLTWLFGYPLHAQAARGNVLIRNDHYVAPSPAPECTPESSDVPCAKGMVNGTAYRYTAYVHCGLRTLIADGRRWAPQQGALGDGNAPAGWGNPDDLGTVQLKNTDVLIYRSSTGVAVELRPDETQPPLCS